MPAIDHLVLLAGVGIGAVAGSGLGRVIGGRKGLVVGAVVGVLGSGFAAYLLTGDLVRTAAWFRGLSVLAALGCGLMAGFFFSFSVLVMDSLAKQPAASGVATMQTINVVVFNPWFAGAFVGTPVVCVLAMIAALLHQGDPGSAYVLLGGACYLVGTLLVTALCNVPRNDALAELTSASPEAERYWPQYLAGWVPWNHVRTISALAASAALTFALIKQVGSS